MGCARSRGAVDHHSKKTAKVIRKIFPVLLLIAAVPIEASAEDKLSALREQAERGDRDAVYLLVEDLTAGAPRYHPEAEKWLRFALENGDQRALRPLAEMLILRGDDPALFEAIKLLRPSASEGSATKARIGRALLEKGYKEEAIGWLQAAALSGDFDSSVKVADLYRVKGGAELSVFWSCHALGIRNDSGWIVSELKKKAGACKDIR